MADLVVMSEYKQEAESRAERKVRTRRVDSRQAVVPESHWMYDLQHLIEIPEHDRFLRVAMTMITSWERVTAVTLFHGSATASHPSCLTDSGLPEDVTALRRSGDTHPALTASAAVLISPLDSGSLTQYWMPILLGATRLGAMGMTLMGEGGMSARELADLNLLGSLIASRLYQYANERRIFTQANHDILTGLPNRATLQDALDRLIERHRLQDTVFAVVMLDLDDFKPINDTHGHAAGDAVLTQVADRLRRESRAGDHIARLGGDEFVLILSECDLPSMVDGALRRFGRALTEPYRLPGQTDIVCGVSMGVSQFTGRDDTRSGEDILRHADRALYESKHKKHDRVDSWSHYESDQSKNKSRRCADLSLNLDRSLVLHYQPIVNVKTKSLAHLEVLSRIVDGDQILAPSSFLPWFGKLACERLFFSVLDKTIAQIRAWVESGFSPSVAINVNPHILGRPEVSGRILARLAQGGVAPERITLEILESEQAIDKMDVVTALNQLHHSGVRIAMDDLGTGYSSFTRLRDIPINEIKLDKTFVRELDKHPKDIHFVRAIRVLAKGLHIDLVAEGVETPEIMAILSKLDIRLMQGYGISRPMPAEEVIDRLRALNYRL